MTPFTSTEMSRGLIKLSSFSSRAFFASSYVFPEIETPETVVPSGNLNSPAIASSTLLNRFPPKMQKPATPRATATAATDEMMIASFFLLFFSPLAIRLPAECFPFLLSDCLLPSQLMSTRSSSTTRISSIKFLFKKIHLIYTQ